MDHMAKGTGKTCGCGLCGICKNGTIGKSKLTINNRMRLCGHHVFITPKTAFVSKI